MNTHTIYLSNEIAAADKRLAELSRQRERLNDQLKRALKESVLPALEPGHYILMMRNNWRGINLPHPKNPLTEDTALDEMWTEAAECYEQGYTLSAIENGVKAQRDQREVIWWVNRFE